MKKIMFNDKYGLTKAVLEGRKTQTRRIVHIDPAIRIDGWKTMHDGSVACAQLFENMWIIDVNYKASYKVGEEVAIAQSYFDTEVLHDGGFSNIGQTSRLLAQPGAKNKMFVKAELMPHRIKITKIRVERLQNISVEECLKEGIICKNGRYRVETNKGVVFYTTDARQAFAYLIDKVSGKGTWDSNPYVFVYDFELVK